MIFDGCTIAESSPIFTASARKTEFKTMRAAGFKPKETFDTPRVVWTSGYFFFNSEIALRVSIPSRLVSSWPVAIGKVRQSIKMSLVSMPQFLVKSSINREATETFHSWVRAWPVSSIVNATTAAPCSLTKGIIFANLEVGPSPSS